MIKDAIFWHQPPGLARAAVYTAIVLLAAVMANRSAFSADGAVLEDEHAVLSLDLAVVRAACGPRSSLSRAARPAQMIHADSGLRYQPLRAIAAGAAGSIEQFCAAADQPFVNNENSLMFLESWILTLGRDLSLSDLGNVMHRVRIAIFAAFVALLIGLGASLGFAFGVFCAGLIVLGSMPQAVYSAYPFLATLVVGVVTLYGAVLRWRLTGQLWTAVVGGVVLGISSGFLANMRTSYLPIAAVIACVFAACEWTRSRERHHRIRVAVTVLSLIAGYIAFDVAMVRPLLIEGSGRVSHSIAHPLVLALGVPETAFSRAEGLSWHDEVGPRKAMTIDPGAPYLSARYQAALMAYYRGLWAAHPGEMLRLYVTKFNVFGNEMFATLKSSPGVVGVAVMVLLTPFSWIPGGVLLLVAYLAVLVVSLRLAMAGSITMFVLAALTIAAVLVHTEAGVIYSLYVSVYHNYAAFFAMMLSLAALQAAVQVLGGAATRNVRIA